MPWIVSPDEMAGNFEAFGGYVPTIGSKAQAIDLYRTVQYQGSDMAEIGLSFTDIKSASALATIIEGGVSNASELAAAEVALQALLLSNAPQIYVPSIKTIHTTGFTGYHREDNGMRSKLAFELFDFDESWDFLAASECVRVDDGIIASSSDRKSSLVGKRIAELSYNDLIANRSASIAPMILSDILAVPAYLSEEKVLRERRGDGFQKRFYASLNESWKRAVANMPPVVCSFSLPPLLSIVLNEAGSRSDIPSIISSLRSELHDVRTELLTFNGLATQSMGQTDIEAVAKRIQDSFDAIVPESRMTSAERKMRFVLMLQRLVSPLTRYAAGFFLNNSGSLEGAFNTSAQTIEAAIKSEIVVDRTLTAKKFAGLARTEAIQQLVKHHFTEAEILAIERSID